MYKIATILLLFCCSYILPAQNFHQMETELKQLFDSLRLTADQDYKMVINSRILSSFDNIFAYEESFDYDFDSLKNHIGNIRSSDKKLRIITWNISAEFGRNIYFGFVQTNIDKDVIAYKLTDSKDVNAETRYAVPDWYGCLYYEIIPFKRSNQTHYILLGLDLNNLFTSRKVIDVFTLDEKLHIPLLGLPVFKYDTEIKKRVIFEYSARAQMALNYHEKKKMIVFDHLSPSHDRHQGNYQFYGPDFSYDAFIFDDGFWKYTENIDIRNY